MFRLDTSALKKDFERLALEVPVAAHAGMSDAALIAYQSAKGSRTFKDRHTGRESLRGSIVVGSKRMLHFFVRAGAAHALFVEEDTVPHEIRAKRAARLTFKIGGQWISKKVVKHPGTKGKHFMRTARDLAEAVIGQLIETRLRALFR